MASTKPSALTLIDPSAFVGVAASIEALGLRTIDHAMRGDFASMHEVAARLRSALEMPGDKHRAAALGSLRTVEGALAHVAVAEAIAVARGGDREALRQHLDRHAELLRGSTSPRERALVRALERCFVEDRCSPYRRGHAATDLDRTIDEWIAATRAATPRPGAEHASDRRSAPGWLDDRRDWTSPKRIASAVGLWCATALAAWAIGMLDPFPHARSTVFAITTAIPLLILAILFLVGLGRAIATNLRRRAFHRAVTAGAIGDTAALERFVASTEPLAVAQACAVLARRKNLAGDFEGALAMAERGLANAQGWGVGSLAAFDIRPALVAERALASACLGQTAEATAALDALPESFAHRDTCSFAVRLVALTRAGDLEAAAALAGARGDFPLDAPIEALADALRATSEDAPLGPADRARLVAALRDRAELLHWIERVAPQVLAALDVPTGRPRIHVSREARPTVEEDGDEALAEAEADASVGRVPARARA